MVFWDEDTDWGFDVVTEVKKVSGKRDVEGMEAGWKCGYRGSCPLGPARITWLVLNLDRV